MDGAACGAVSRSGRERRSYCAGVPVPDEQLRAWMYERQRLGRTAPEREDGARRRHRRLQLASVGAAGRSMPAPPSSTRPRSGACGPSACPRCADRSTCCRRRPGTSPSGRCPRRRRARRAADAQRRASRTSAVRRAARGRARRRRGADLGARAARGPRGRGVADTRPARDDPRGRARARRREGASLQRAAVGRRRDPRGRRGRGAGLAGGRVPARVRPGHGSPISRGGRARPRVVRRRPSARSRQRSSTTACSCAPRTPRPSTPRRARKAPST